MATECERLVVLMDLINSPDTDVVELCVRMIYSLLKTRTDEVCINIVVWLPNQNLNPFQPCGGANQ